jgi:antitoxin VapB
VDGGRHGKQETPTATPNPRRPTEVDRLAREVAARTGETLTAAAAVALRERLARLEGRPRRRPLREDLREIARRCASLPALDDRPADEIVGYDERGVPR